MRARGVGVILLGLLLIAAGVSYFVASTSTGSLAVQVRDTPLAWSQVLVTFSEVSVHPASAANDSGWRLLPLRVGQVDLLALGNLTKLLATDQVAPGLYSGVRILVSAASGVLTTGVPVSISVTSGVLEAAVPFLVRGGTTTTVTLDLNLSQSLLQTSGGWVFTPVLGPTEIG